MKKSATMNFVLQIASVPASQIGFRDFHQNKILHESLIENLIKKDQQKKIFPLNKIAPKHRILLSSGFSQTSRWGLEPNMFLQVRKKFPFRSWLSTRFQLFLSVVLRIISKLSQTILSAHRLFRSFSQRRNVKILLVVKRKDRPMFVFFSTF